jgi:hypothetical protein
MMNFKSILTGALALAVLSSTMLAPVSALANGGDQGKHRQQKKNEWRNLAIGSGALAILGLLKHDGTLTFLGAAGALYSANRYEQDRRSQNRASHGRYVMFHRGSFVRNGHRYSRRTVYRHGHKYYQFVRRS